MRKPFVADLGTHGVVLTGAKYKLTAVVVNLLGREPSHLTNALMVAPMLRIMLRLAHVPAERARELSERYEEYMRRSIDAQCDAMVIEPFGKKISGALTAAFREDVLKGLPELIQDICAAVEEAHS